MRQGLTMLAGAVLAAATNAEASPFDRQTTGELRAICASENALDQHFCIGFILGAGQLITDAADRGGRAARLPRAGAVAGRAARHLREPGWPIPSTPRRGRSTA
ncbi:MAG: hypothetical protein R3C69_00180 [Geminicoccaceae bacterium]